MTSPAPPVTRVSWVQAFRIIRSRFPPINLFEDIADAADWDALASAEIKTNARFAETIGRLDLVAPDRRVAGPGASYVMAAFTHVTPDRPSRFADGSFGAYYAADAFEVALAETLHHHERFMAATAEAPGWTSDFRELIGPVDAALHDLTGGGFESCLDPDSYEQGQALARALRAAGSDGLLYPSVRQPGGLCIAVFYPDVVGLPVQGRHLSYHWNGAAVDSIQDLTTGTVYRVA
jgi:hypothetical protein